MIRVTFLPDGERVRVEEGTTLREAAIKAGFLNCKGDNCNSCWSLFEIGGEYKPGCTFELREDVIVNLNSRGENWKGENISEVTKIALDIGTTTITAAFFDESGEKIGSEVVINPQIAYGSDVVSRIEAINRDANLLAKMRSKLLKEVNQLIEKRHLEKVEEIGIAGNPCMEHILLGVSPSGIGGYPYEPEFKNAAQMNAREVGIDAGCEVFILPLISGWVGGDTVAMILSTGIHRSEEKVMGIDLGTNGEIVFGSKDGIITTSTAAGPAFEGVGITYGMPATDGAIENVRINEKGEVRVKIKGGKKAKGICGSGILDSIAEMLKREIMDTSGRMKWRAFHIHDGIYITQKDVRKVQLAKSAISTGVEMLKRELDLGAVKRTIVTGSFGNASAESLSVIGISGALFKKDAVIEGIKRALFGEKREAERIARESRWINLASHPSFSDGFMKNLGF
ncbi:MAG: DUF4445 domain-containing protein [Methanophagales archaeon]|nr:DUF4445 domain-containing protein [Methanophagales archaeon]